MDHLPEEILTKVFGWVGTARDLYACEKTCRKFRRVLQDDEIWGHCVECRPLQYETSNRETALINRALIQCKKWQKSTDSAILDVLDVDDWEGLAITSLMRFADGIDELVEEGNIFRLRGDALATLLIVVEDIMVIQLKRAFQMTLLAGPRTYPSVTVGDWFAQAKFHNFEMKESPMMAESFLLSTFIYFSPTPTLSENGVNMHTKDKIIRRLAFRAGIPKLDDAAYPFIWASLFKTIGKLIEPACNHLAGRSLEKAGEKRPLRYGEKIRDVPPFPRMIGCGCPDCGCLRIFHWIVPKQIEDAAKDMIGFGCKIYGEDWLVDDSSFPNGGIEDIEDYYEWKERKKASEIEMANSYYCFVEDEEDSNADETSFEDEVETGENYVLQSGIQGEEGNGNEGNEESGSEGEKESTDEAEGNSTDEDVKESGNRKETVGGGHEESEKAGSDEESEAEDQVESGDENDEVPTGKRSAEEAVSENKSKRQRQEA